MKRTFPNKQMEKKWLLPCQNHMFYLDLFGQGTLSDDMFGVKQGGDMSNSFKYVDCLTWLFYLFYIYFPGSCSHSCSIFTPGVNDLNGLSCRNLLYYMGFNSQFCMMEIQHASAVQNTILWGRERQSPKLDKYMDTKKNSIGCLLFEAGGN